HKVSGHARGNLPVWPTYQLCFCLALSCQVHPSLVINMNQTGVHLVPSAGWTVTYERINSAAMAVLGAEDKRQITVCLASSLDGELLPLQLIFQGKTDRSLPAATAYSLSSRADITCSENHWSSQQTMQRYIEKVILPYSERAIQRHTLHSDAEITLVLDGWSEHRSEEFRRYLRTLHPRTHLVSVPAHCTSKLQGADVVLQRPLQHGSSRRFNEWAAERIAGQIETGQ